MTELVHYSEKPLKRPIGSIPICEQGRGHHKPEGFWISVDGNGDGWREWCESARYIVTNLAYRTPIILRVGASIKWLRSVEDIEIFDDLYGIGSFRDYDRINWKAVAGEYDGIFIAPYQQKLRLADHCCWYSTWDCASGCIWNGKVLELGESEATGVKVEEVA